MFRTAWFCVNCDEEMTHDQKMYSNGRCRHCGFKHERAGTIVETYEKAYKEVRVPSGKWWKWDTFKREFVDA